MARHTAKISSGSGNLPHPLTSDLILLSLHYQWYPDLKARQDISQPVGLAFLPVGIPERGLSYRSLLLLFNYAGFVAIN
jgi:hypothetical protein